MKESNKKQLETKTHKITIEIEDEKKLKEIINKKIIKFENIKITIEKKSS